MRVRNLPTIDAGYWAAIVAASMCGTNAGDLAAGPLGLGHVNGILPIALVFLAIVWAEKKLNWTTVAFYWLAIIVLRTMATNIADFATHDMKLSYPVFLVILAVLMAVMVWADGFFRGDQRQAVVSGPQLPSVDWSYWVLMLAAGVFGTALGDWWADDLFGVYWASLIGWPFFAGAVWLAYRFGLSKPWYWFAIAACRTWGTDLGDMLVRVFRLMGASRSVSLWVSTVLTAILLAGIIYYWTHRNVASSSDAVPERSA